MKLWKKIAITLLVLAILGAGIGYWLLTTRDQREPSLVAFNAECASCHGKDLAGTEFGPALVGADLTHGDSTEDLILVISAGVPETTMPGYEGEMTPQMIKALALYVSERRQNFVAIRDSYAFAPSEGRVIESEHHRFRLERVATLQSRPYSLDVLSSGEVIIAEKDRGLSIVGADGTQSPLISGTPEVWDTLLTFDGAWLNLGSMLDVELHPDYAENGWVYLSHTDRCQLSCGWLVPATMVRVVRGRIVDGAWIDEELIWSVHPDHYTPVPDGVAAGRLAFDDEGHVFVSIGGKNTYDKLHQLDTPFGKIHRVRDDGSIPSDNPYWAPEEERPEASTKHTVWSYGHRTGQGLDGHPTDGSIWNAEMGPRGGDEVNRILGGQNYGWPLYTNGLDYDGEEVSIGKDLGLDFAIEDTVLPVVDFTPAPAVSNMTFHRGEAFTGWANDILVGTLKAGALYRLRIEDDELVEQEKLFSNFGRIRDVEMGPDGHVYFVIEHNDNGSLWRMSPLEQEVAAATTQTVEPDLQTP